MASAFDIMGGRGLTNKGCHKPAQRLHSCSFHKKMEKSIARHSTSVIKVNYGCT